MAAKRAAPLATLFSGLAARRAPGVLYHYTSQQGLIGIFQSGSFWATNIRYLNDAKEFELALELLDDVLHSKLQTASNKYDQALYTVLQESLNQASGSDVYVTSFSEDGDQLGQWRAYCPAGSGYAVGLLPAVLRRAHGSYDRLLLLRCLYDEDEHRTLLHRLIGLAETYIHDAKVAQSTNPDRVYREAFKLFDAWLPTVAAVIKHSSFSEEREWRLLAPTAFFDHEPPSVRSGRSMLIPYQQFALSDSETAMQVSSIVIGPTPHSSLAEQGVRALCVFHGTRNASIEVSDIPYRTW